jgi:hypothetical protein
MYHHAGRDRLMISGLITGFASFKHRCPVAPYKWPSFKPAAWQVQRKWFSDERGYVLHRVSGLLMAVGSLLCAVVLLVS